MRAEIVTAALARLAKLAPERAKKGKRPASLLRRT
jgi:hypothetical protein